MTMLRSTLPGSTSISWRNSKLRPKLLPLTLPLAITIIHSITTNADGLHLALITGSTRTSGPPTVLGPRVTTYLKTTLEKRGHTISHIDPKDFNMLGKPHFAYPPGKAPEKLEEVYSILKNATGYVCVTPEYNHSPSPALVNVLNHFGSSVFSFKPSAIVTYSAGQWGGTRAAVGLRTTLSELGCLPVSAMIHIPKAQEVLHRDGTINNSLERNNNNNNDSDQWEQYCGRCFSQLEWWAEAARRYGKEVDPFNDSPVFLRSPSERNAP